MARKKIICPNCGGEYDASLTCCPYCGTQNDEAAEKEYLGRIGKINRNLRNLPKGSGEQLAGSAARGVRRAVLIIALIVGTVLLAFGIWRAYSKNEVNKHKSDYTAVQECYKQLDAYYEAGDYDAMCAYYQEASEDHDIYHWKHARLCYALDAMQEVDEYWQQEKEAPLDANDLAEVMYCELEIAGVQYDSDAPDQDVAYVDERKDAYIDDLNTRFLTTPELQKQFADDLKEYGGVPSYEQCQKRIKETSYEKSSIN
ncbi:MAG: hypothetical protein ACOX74_07960 [Lachnospiraceae bacterium]|jgi:hypothetical protein